MFMYKSIYKYMCVCVRGGATSDYRKHAWFISKHSFNANSCVKRNTKISPHIC